MSVEELESKLKQLEKDALEALSGVSNSAALEDLRLTYLGQKGELTTVLRGLSTLSKEERPRVGQLANAVKEKIQATIEERKDELYRAELNERLASEKLDMTLQSDDGNHQHFLWDGIRAC
jgi:phenylalanyl-tRNA synthetase alpha chain